jgi:hypothetical protein
VKENEMENKNDDVISNGQNKERKMFVNVLDTIREGDDDGCGDESYNNNNNNNNNNNKSLKLNETKTSFNLTLNETEKRNFPKKVKGEAKVSDSEGRRMVDGMIGNRLDNISKMGRVFFFFTLLFFFFTFFFFFLFFFIFFFFFFFF